MFAQKAILCGAALTLLSALVQADHDPQAPACLDRLAHEDYVTANALCARLANTGDAQGMFAMGRIYAESLGHQGDQVAAVQMFTRSVAAGYVPSAYYLGVAYEYGRGVEQNLPQAVAYYRQAADASIPEAQFKLGQLMLKGSGVRQSLDLGQRWIRLAARSGHQDAQVTLAILQADTDFESSLSWYQKAAVQENSDALYNLAAIYFNGDRVEADLPRALDYARRSLEAGHERAGVLYDAIFDRVMSLHGVTAAGKPASAGFAAPGLKNRGWLFSQPEENYVLQLAQFKNMQAMKTYLDKFALAEKVDYYRSVTKLGPVYVVLYRSQFASYGDAKKGMAAQLPAEVAKGGWIRQLAALQKVYSPVQNDSLSESHASL